MPTPKPSPQATNSSDPGLRFVAPAGRPTVVGGHALDVLRAAGLSPRLDVRVATSWLVFAAYSSSRSFYEGLEVVPPRVGIVRAADGGLARIEPAPAVRTSMSVDDATEGLRTRLASATHDAIADAASVGIPLSGGLDSSAVAVMASHAWRSLGRDPARLRCYHLLPRSGPTEVSHARAVAAHLGHAMVEIPAAEGDPFEGDDALRGSLDFPADGGGMATALRLAGAMRDDGIEVVLTGDGGDEAVGPVGGRLPPRGAREHGVRLVRRTAGIVLGPARSALRRRRFLASLPPWLAAKARGLSEPDARPRARPGLDAAQSARDQALRNARQGMIVEWWRALGRIGAFTARFPFLDPRVTDFVTSLPAPHLSVDGVAKGLLRRALGGRLPTVVQARPKDQPEVESQLAVDLRLYGPSWLDRYLRGAPLEGSGLVPMSGALESLHLARGDDPSTLSRAYALVGLAAWCRLRDVVVT